MFAVRVANALGKPLGLDPFPRAFPNAANVGEDRTAIFERIYLSNFWASEQSRSGVGSEKRFAKAYRKRLRDCLDELGAKRLFDAPCGDLNWIAPLTGQLDYLGGDISPSLIADLKVDNPGLQLTVFDICRDRFPQADVWHCRDCLFHLPFADIRSALRNFAQSSIPYALLTTHKARLHRNLDVAAGGFRYLDLERAPFNLPLAERYLRDYRFGRDFPRYVALWRREVIADALRNA